MIKVILRSLGITAIVSLTVAIFGSVLFDVNYYKSFSIAFMCQLALSYLWNSVLQFLYRMRVETEETKRVEMYTTQGVTADCAFCKTPNYIPIRMDEANDFKCESCGKENSIYIDITVAQKTAIIDKESLSITEYMKEKTDG